MLQISGDIMDEEKNDNNGNENNNEEYEVRQTLPQEAEGGSAKKRRKFRLWSKPLPAPENRYSKSFRIALSGISCALAAIFLSLGFFSGVLIATGFLIAEVALMVPLSKQFILGDFLAYLGTVLIAIIFGAVAQFWSLIPFIMFFGLHPLANCLQIKYSVNRWIALLVKMIWFDVTLYVAYIVVFNGVLGASAGQSAFFDFINEYIWLFIIVIGSLFLWVYDYIMFKVQIWINRLVYRIKK